MDAVQRRNLTLNTVGEALWGCGAALAPWGTVLPLLLERFGASKMQIGAVSGIEAGFLLPQIIGAMWMNSRRHQQRNLMLWHFLVIIPAIGLMVPLLAGSRWLPSGAICWGLLGAYTLFTVSVGIILAVWNDWLAHIFRTTIRGSAFGLAFAGSALAGAGASRLGGWLLELRPGVETYAALFGGFALLGTLSIVVFCFVRDAGRHTAPAQERPTFARMLGNFRASLADRNFRAYLVGRTFEQLAAGAAPFVAVFLKEQRQISDGLIVSFSAAGLLAMAAASLGLGWMGDRLGHRVGALVGAAAAVASLVCLLAVPGWLGCVLVYAFSGMAIGARIVSHTNLVIETCPHEARTAHLTLGNMVVAVVGMAGALLAGTLARWSLVAMFCYAGGMGTLALLWYILRVRDPREGAALEAGTGFEVVMAQSEG